MKRSLMLVLAFATLTAAAAKPTQQPLRPEMKDGGGTEPPCPITICGNPGLQFQK
jgi:hypothetical protein